MVLRQVKRNSEYNCDVVLNFVISAFLLTRPGRPKSRYVTGRTQNIRDKPTLEKLTLMIFLAKASKRLSHNKAFDTHCNKDIWCLIILNKFAITTFWAQQNTTVCPHSVFMCGSEDKQRLFPYTALNGWTLGAFV